MQTNSQRGFTIIETLIVLAIAGLILSLILVVIPTLQRNGRNNQRKQDVQIVLGGISNFMLNHSGGFPQTNNDGDFRNRVSNLSYYDMGNIEVRPLAARQPVGDLSSLDLDKVIVANHQKCDADNPGNATFIAAGYSDIVALYRTETGGGASAQRCQEL